MMDTNPNDPDKVAESSSSVFQL